MARILLTHADEARAQYYGDDALARLRELGEVRLNESGQPLATPQLIELARGCQVIVSDRTAAGPAAVFEQLEGLVAFVRCAVDIRNVDVGAASARGVLVTRASPGFVDAVAELVVGFMVDLARGVSDATIAYRAGAQPAVRMGRQLRGSKLGIIGYGHIGTRLAQLGLALGMQVLVNDPYVQVVEPELKQTDLGTLLVEADFVVVLAVATAETENLIGAEELGWMKPSAVPDQRRARRPDRRGGAGDGAARGPHRRLRDGRRARPRPDAVAEPGPPAKRRRDAARRRPRAAGDRPSGARDHPPGRRDRAGPGAPGRGQSRACVAPRPPASELMAAAAGAPAPELTTHIGQSATVTSCIVIAGLDQA